jgi:polar amino acid transport system substrate-binding protein
MNLYNKLNGCFLILLLFVCGELKAQKLKVGMELSYPPFETVDKNGNPTGVSVDLAKALAEELKRPVEIVNMSFDGLIPALKTGSIDLIISSLTVNEDRKKSIDFSIPYVKTGLAMLVSKDSKVSGLENIDNTAIKVAVKKGTTGQSWALAHLKYAKVLSFDKENAAVLEVLQKKVDLFIYDQLSIYSNWQKHKENSRALLQPIQSESWAIGVRKGQVELLNSVNKFLEKFKQKKGFESLSEKYFGSEKKVFKELGVEFIL